MYTKQQDARSRENVARIAASGAGGVGLTPAKRADLADKANDNVTAELAKNMRLNMEVMKNPARRQQLVQTEFQRLLDAAGATSATSDQKVLKFGDI
jgi:hypothetical protein